ncbi:hypothetical protein ACFQV2_03065 [Actinokineospora soli]|uniref:RsbT co-antagonist protein RsbRD N-terminal domain-containing protein n=1 Tax=Actinokineospora soli TaxID=1048753 RepID=A0ABW2TIW2_9PSEU
MSPLPPELAAVAKGQLERLPVLADELAAVLRDKEEFYRRVDENAPAELRKVCEVNLRNAFDAFIECRDVDLECARKTARAQARLGIPLPAVLRAFRIAGTFSYEAIVERAIPPGTITPEQLLPVSNTIWRIIDAYSEAIATAYTEVAADNAHYDEKARAALLDNLLEGRFTRQAEFDDAARGLGLPPAGRSSCSTARRASPARRPSSTRRAGARCGGARPTPRWVWSWWPARSTCAACATPWTASPRASA